VVCALWRVKGTNFCLPSVVPELRTKKTQYSKKKEKNYQKVAGVPSITSIPYIIIRERNTLPKKY